MNIFEQAAKKALRFSSDRGELTTEQVYTLPLSFLDGLAKGVNVKIKDLQAESFVEINPNPEKKVLELKLDLLKHIIKDKLDSAEAQKKALIKHKKKELLLGALEAKEGEALSNMSKEELLKELEEV